MSVLIKGIGEYAKIVEILSFAYCKPTIILAEGENDG